MYLILLSLLGLFIVAKASGSPRLGTLVLLVALAGATFELVRATNGDLEQGWKDVKAGAEALLRGDPPTPEQVGITWPPVLNEPYPDLQLIDQDGRRTSLAEFKGKVILIEPIGMPCRACIAFAGGHDAGPFDGIPPQGNLKSIETFAREYGWVNLDDERIVLVQILFYNHDMTAPTPADARRWAEHFGLARADNRVVLAAEPYLVSPATQAMIPGFQLIDRDFVLRYDSTGHRPRHDLYTELLPGIRELLQ